MLFDLKDKLDSLADYKALLSKVFGEKIGNDETISEILSGFERY
jgi:hypothetical protein